MTCMLATGHTTLRITRSNKCPDIKSNTNWRRGFACIVFSSFRGSIKKSDRELLEQLVNNTPKLLEIFPYSQSLPCYEDRMLLIKL